MTTTPIWQPSRARIESTNMFGYMGWIKDEYKSAKDVASFSDLYRWSVDNPEDFWHSIWISTGVISQKDYDHILEDGDKMPGAKWFTGAELSYAENLLCHNNDQPAIIFRNERGHRRELTHAELYLKVAQLASALRANGVTKGDRVVGFIPNMPEAIIGLLAANSIGAVWSSCSPDFGVKGVMDRFGQIEPKVLISADGYYWNGKQIDSLERLQAITAELPDLEHVVVVPYTSNNPVLSAIPNATLWDDFVDHKATEIEFTPLPFDHPLYIMYSSGTTGLPKSIVHGQGGVLLQHLKELVLHTDLRPNSKIFYYTTCGWMMWNWLVSSLATGASVLLYDGSPFYPDGNVLWDIAAEEGMNIFGTSAKYISALEKHVVKPAETHDLSALKAILSTGSPLTHENFEYVYRDIKEDLCLASISGGTDIVSCFALGNPIAPVYKGELQTRGLGLAVDVFDDAGNPLRGEKGELVCKQPFPAMPVYFWNDPDGQKYHDAYFDHYPNVWRHGDWAELTEHDGLIIYGRSDATLNPGGVRIGTAEIYRQVEQLDEILESIVVGQQWENDVRVVLFVKLREGRNLTQPLRDRIRTQIRHNATPRHVPAKIIAIADIPRTISGKIVELAVQNVIHGKPVKNRDALANPQALDLYRDLEELKS